MRQIQSIAEVPLGETVELVNGDGDVIAQITTPAVFDDAAIVLPRTVSFEYLSDDEHSCLLSALEYARDTWDEERAGPLLEKVRNGRPVIAKEEF